LLAVSSRDWNPALLSCSGAFTRATVLYAAAALVMTVTLLGFQQQAWF
jgi:hypothetical protein